MSVHVLRGIGEDRRFLRRWLGAASELRDLLHSDGTGFDPLGYNETATVGFLVAAAGRANLLSLPEFTESNRKLPEGRVRAGRCDMWIASEDWQIDWLLEFKVAFYGPRAGIGLVRKLNAAIENVFDRDRAEAGRRFGCVVFCPGESWFDLDEEAQTKWKTPATIERLASHVDLAVRFDDLAGPAYLLMKEVARRARNVGRYKVMPAVLGFPGG
ncbi:hypothetical protein J2792_000002 [Novosphingobium capsulatum]|uniref:Restriction endonuclease n=1 Tax=Novosphingobium capsulatum TaxID=13688 RepID=A0ABU1MGM6_9SPHN|nr:hypothetical protein [Novosphingobium capsulatum]MDR6509162.1 hypothetical protein [Novosphingobium capsulatum]